MSKIISFEMSRYLKGMAFELKQSHVVTEYSNGQSKMEFVTSFKPSLWAELADALREISEGADPAIVFAKNKRSNPGKPGLHEAVALAYWFARASNPNARVADAVSFACRVIPDANSFTRETVKTYANEYRDDCLQLLALRPGIKCDFEGSELEIRTLGIQGLQPLLAHLKKRTDRDKWRPFVPKAPNEVIFKVEQEVGGAIGTAVVLRFPGLSFELDTCDDFELNTVDEMSDPSIP